MSQHLDLVTWQALLGGTLDATRRASVQQHLQEPCAQCEELLATAPHVDALDGVVDSALLAVAPAQEARFDAVGFRRVERAMQRQRWLQRAPWLATGAVAAAALLFAVMPRPTTEHLKGSAAATKGGLRLEALRVDGDQVRPLPRNAEVTVGTQVALRLHLDGEGCVALWQLGVRTEPLLDEALCLPAGDHVLQRGGQVLGLAIERGRTELVALPVARGTAVAATRALLVDGLEARGGDRFPLRGAAPGAPEP